MAYYLLRIPGADVADQFQLVESDSAKQAVDHWADKHEVEGSFDVWTMRSKTARVFTVSTETLRTVKQT